MKQGDYVLATKWHDGDPHDHWYIGFYDHEAKGRHYIVDGEGNLVRANGFRRVCKLSAERGWLLLQLKEQIQQGNKSVWWWKRQTLAFLESAMKPF